MNALGIAAALLAAAAGPAGNSIDEEIRSLAAGWAARSEPAPGGDTRRIPFDEPSGRRLANYPPHRQAIIENLRLDLAIDDMDTPVLNGVETLTLAPIGWKLDEYVLSARAMKISRVESPGRDATFEHDGSTLRIRLDPAPAPGERTTIVTTYIVNDPPAGLVWTPASPAWPGRPSQLHSQGQPQSNSYWFPCPDFPNQRFTTEMRVTVPQGYEVLSNGRLISRSNVVRSTRDKLGGSLLLPAEAFHWAQDQKAGGAHVPYLVSLVVGKFDVVDVGSQSLPMPVYVPRGRAKDVAATFGRTPAMIDAFASLFGEPYPWSKYAQAVVWNFGGGGMENTSATTLYDTALITADPLGEFDLDGLISHELAHQWFGDLITCNSWEHVWLNEGFATYASALWTERRPGPRGGVDAYQASVRAFMDGLIASDRPEAPYAQGMVSKVYDSPWEAFGRPANPYAKGASVLHMLRARFGDDLFFLAVAAYVDRCKLRTVETADLRRSFEETTGESLQQFFAQWCDRPGVPTLSVTPVYDAPTRELRVTVEQTQNIDGDNPAFEFTLPVWVGDGTPGPGTWLNVDVAGRKATASTVLPGEPRIIAVDPGMSVLAGVKVALSREQWLAQLEAGPTHASKVQAARALGAMGGGDGAAGAANTLFDTAMNRQQHWSLRAECAHALAAMKDVERVETLAAAQLTPLWLRESVVNALADAAARGTPGDAGHAAPASRAVALLADLAAREPSFKARAAAVAALGKLKAADRTAPVLAAARTDSQDDVLRQAAAGALGEIGGADALRAILALTSDGNLHRTRVRATESLGNAGSADRDAAVKRLAELVADRSSRVRGAARQSIVDLGDPRGLDLLTKPGARQSDADLSDARDCARRLKEKLGRAATPASSPGAG